MWRAEKAWRDELAKVTIAGIIHDALEQMPAEQRDRGVDWLKKTLGGT
jgi:HD superfamily phosphohydrolase YqeK